MKPAALACRIGGSLQLILGLALPWAAHASDSQYPASGHVCPASDVLVIAADARDASDVCDGVQAVEAFFAEHGLRAAGPLVVEVTTLLPVEAGPTAVGCYLDHRKRVFMLQYAEFRKQKTFGGIPIDRGLYRSLAVHEVAHAVAATGFAVPRPSIQAQEYVAYVTMFATMDTTIRTRFLRAHPGKGFASEDRITSIFYMFHPLHFGAESYRHYVRPGNGATFLQSVLAGKVLAE